MNIKTCLASIFAMLFLCGCSGKEDKSDATEYESMTISPCTVVVKQSFPASIKGAQDVDILPQIDGRIIKVCVKEGQEVKIGQPLFLLDKVSYQAALHQARANVEAANAKVATATLELQSKQILFNEKVVSEYELMSARNALAEAKAQLEQAKAQLLDASNSLGYTTVNSPTNGVVGSLPFKTGTIVSPEMGQPLTTISDNSTMAVYFSFSEKELQKLIIEYGSMSEFINKMPPVQLVLSSGDKYPESGKITAISGVLNTETGSAQAKVLFPNENGLLLSGGVGNIIIPHIFEDAISIPQGAVYELQDKKFVYKVVDGKAQSTQIEVYPVSDGKTYTVTAGLDTGDVIITVGVGMIKDGDEVKSRKEATDEP